MDLIDHGDVDMKGHMKVHIAADHRGFTLKEELKAVISSLGHDLIDHGNTQYEPSDDYPDFSVSAAQAVALDDEARGIVICGSGVGVCVVANKIPGVRCVLGFNPDQVRHARESDNVTVLALPADYVRLDAAIQLVSIFLETPFAEDSADIRRLKKIANLEDRK